MAFVGGVGLPSTAGFVAELHVLIGGFHTWSLAIVLLSLGVLITATYSIRTVKHLYTGPVRLEMQQVEDLRPLEMVAAGSLIVGTLVLGFYPASLLEMMQVSVQNFVASGGLMP
jgi:NADH-quinone oxidoreductase subunit M